MSANAPIAIVPDLLPSTPPPPNFSRPAVHQLAPRLAGPPGRSGYARRTAQTGYTVRMG
jgi:hypothetical protein